MKAKFLIAGILFSTAVVVPAFYSVNAENSLPNNPATTQDPDGGKYSGNPIDPAFQLVPCDGTDCDFKHVVILASRVIKFVLFMMTPIVIAMLVYTGFKYMAAGGDVNLIADAKRMFKPIIIGLILIFGAWILVYTVLDKLLVDKIGDIDKSTIVPSAVSNSNN
jgi:hypothetical protein